MTGQEDQLPITESEWDEWLASHSWMVRTLRSDLTHQDFAWQPIGEWTYKTPDTKGFHGLSPREDQRSWNIVRQMTAWSLPVLCEVPSPMRWMTSVRQCGIAEVDMAKIVVVGDDIPAKAYSMLGWTVLEGNDANHRRIFLCRHGTVNVQRRAESSWIFNEGATVMADGVPKVDWVLRGGHTQISGQRGGSILLLGGTACLIDCESVNIFPLGRIHLGIEPVEFSNGGICLSHRTT